MLNFKTCMWVHFLLIFKKCFIRKEFVVLHLFKSIMTVFLYLSTVLTKS
jgi:hypothetical protein